jgi:ABC-type phosphate transport system substrate-binding protein
VTGTSPTPCGFNVCAGGSATGAGAGQWMAPVHLEIRSDVSGTTQSFLARLVAAGASATTTPIALGFTGCGGDNQFDGCGLAYTSGAATASEGNPAVIAATSTNPDGLGYASDGLVQASGSGVIPVNFQGIGQTVTVNIQGESTALSAIASGISAYSSGSWAVNAQAYVGWRPFLNVETAPPTGEVLRYLQFVMDPANNENIAAETAEISVYGSGLAGHVPVTPIP